MGIKTVGCDCRQPGYPKHTHTHYGEIEVNLLRGTEVKVAASVRLKRHERKLTWLWTLLVLALLVLWAWAKHRVPELEELEK